MVHLHIRAEVHASCDGGFERIRSARAFAQKEEPGVPPPDDRSVTNAITAPPIAGWSLPTGDAPAGAAAADAAPATKRSPVAVERGTRQALEGLERGWAWPPVCRSPGHLARRPALAGMTGAGR